MINIDSEIKKAQIAGFKEIDATAKICQDIIISSISRSAMIDLLFDVFIDS